jgi:hypothetical protein
MGACISSSLVAGVQPSKHNEVVMLTGVPGRLFVPLCLFFGPLALSGCAASEGSRAPADPASQATAFKQTRCSGYADDAPVADILNGSAVEDVTPLYSGGVSKTSSAKMVGASFYVRPAAGETAEWLNRAIECHSARQTADRSASPASASDPFFLPDSVVSVRVHSAGDTFRIDVEGRSSVDARAIIARAGAFARASGAAAHGMAAQLDLP